MSDGFKVIPLKFSEANSSCHELFVKEHSVKAEEENKPPGLTLFVLNIPPYATEESLKHAFSLAGKIKRVILEKTKENYEKQDGFQRGFIVFFKRKYLLKALKLEALNPLSSSEKPLLTGYKKYKKEYNASICDPKKLRAETEQFMVQFEKIEKTKEAEEAVVDDEGWTVVTKSGRKPGISRKESVANKLIEKTKKGSKRKELKNFYTFQKRENQIKKIAALRKDFEEAKEKVNLMKKARNFKPF